MVLIAVASSQVVAVVKSAVEGSEEALGQLQKGAGAGNYKSAIKAEVWKGKVWPGEL